ncbi:MAG: LysM peptidoglycan-binding domain-containing protein [Spirochaetales bacterium]
MKQYPAFVSPLARAITLIVVELVVLVVVIAAILFLPPFGTMWEEVSEVDVSPPAESEPDEPDPEPADPEPDAEPRDVDPDDRRRIDEHTIRSDDTLWDLAEEYWDNRHLWPDLYVENENGLDDPDDLTVGDTLSIPESLVANGHLGDDARDSLMDAYIRAYRSYSRSADRLERQAQATGSVALRSRAKLKRARSQWLLYSGTRFEENYMNARMGEIRGEDLELVDTYLERFGRPPSPLR